jgi:hypothetical protein
MLAALLKPFQRKHVIEVTAPVITFQSPLLKKPGENLIKVGKWVRVQEQNTGIVAEMSADGILTVAIVNPNTGADDSREKVYPGNVRLARFAEIPKVRIPELTQQQAAALGYF